MYVPRVVPSEADDMPRFMNEELQRLSRGLSEPADSLFLSVLHVEPSKPRNGMIVEASGSPGWDPGSGAGCYIYRSGWVKLG